MLNETLPQTETHRLATKTPVRRTAAGRPRDDLAPHGHDRGCPARDPLTRRVLHMARGEAKVIGPNLALIVLAAAAMWLATII
jgi:hypothetical protein